MKASLTGTVDLAPDVRHFEFELGDGEFVFTPGQFISIKGEVDGREITRAYSIASPPDGRKFALCLNRVPEGLVSPRLFSLKLGEQISIEQPLGYFTLRHPERDALFVATGTGIAPFRSILLHRFQESDARPITLLFGVRFEESLLYGREFEELAAKHANFKFMPTVSRPSASWTGRAGRVHAHMDEALSTLNTPDVYICGLNEMVDEVRAGLKQRGFDRKRIIYEKYD